jgi:hypothetical protein
MSPSTARATSRRGLACCLVAVGIFTACGDADGPDVATVTGNIGEQPVSTTVDRADGCGINEWDQILGDVLPPPRDVNGAE